MTLYADILFIVNFIMNGFVLLLLSKIMRRKRKTGWILAGAGAMALLYTLVIAAPPLRFINVALASVVILSVGIAIAFRPRGINFLKFIAAAYGVSFTVGGLGMALFFLTDIPYAIYFIASDFQAFAGVVSWQLALAGASASYILIKIFLRLAERYTLKRQVLCNVRVFLGEHDCSFDALVDTGHSLKEPISQCPVIIAEFELFKPFLPEGLEDISGLCEDRQSDFYNRVRIIPFTSVGQTNGMLIGFRPDKIIVEGTKNCRDAVIAVYNDKLCKNGRYRGLLSPELMAA